VRLLGVPVGRLKEDAGRDPLGGRRLAAVYRRGQGYVVTANRRYGYGPWLRSPPYAVLKRSASDADLGEAVVRAIEGFEYMAVAPTPAEIDRWNRELYEVVGVKDERTFERGASVLSVAEDARQWTLQPQDRRRGYWVPLNEDTHLHLTDPSAEEIGVAVRQVLH
jgi:hypothetical protein